MNEFSNLFESPEQMWAVMSAEFDHVKLSDTEMVSGLKKLGGTIHKFSETQSIIEKEDGVSMDEALKIVEKRGEKPNEEYSFILFVILKNLENSGLIKINGRAERIARGALKDYETKKRK